MVSSKVDFHKTKNPTKRGFRSSQIALGSTPLFSFSVTCSTKSPKQFRGFKVQKSTSIRRNYHSKEIFDFLKISRHGMKTTSRHLHYSMKNQEDLNNNLKEIFVFFILSLQDLNHSWLLKSPDQFRGFKVAAVGKFHNTKQPPERLFQFSQTIAQYVNLFFALQSFTMENISNN